MTINLKGGKIDQAIQTLCPNCEYEMEGYDYTKITWITLPQTIPTVEEIEAELLKIEQQDNIIQCRERRRLEYPSIGDQLDALWKGGEAAAEMAAKIQAVKNKYPKG